MSLTVTSIALDTWRRAGIGFRASHSADLKRERAEQCSSWAQQNHVAGSQEVYTEHLLRSCRWSSYESVHRRLDAAGLVTGIQGIYNWNSIFIFFEKMTRLKEILFQNSRHHTPWSSFSMAWSKLWFDHLEHAKKLRGYVWSKKYTYLHWLGLQKFNLVFSSKISNAIPGAMFS